MSVPFILHRNEHTQKTTTFSKFSSISKMSYGLI